MQEKTERLSEAARKLGLTPSGAKTPGMNTTGGTYADIKHRIKKAKVVFNMLRKIWSSKHNSINTKMCIFNSNVKQGMVYGSETRRTTKHTTNSLKTFINVGLRTILNIRETK